MTREELRLKCLEAIIPQGTKYGMQNGEIFIIAEKTFEFVTKEAPSEKLKEQPKGSKSK